MKKIVRDICIAFVILCLICFAFWQIGWITSTKEIGIMFLIAVVVILIDLLLGWIWKKLIKRQ